MITGAIITNIVIKKSKGQQSIALQTNNDYMLSFKEWSKLWLVQSFSDLAELTTFSTFQGPISELCVLWICISDIHFISLLCGILCLHSTLSSLFVLIDLSLVPLAFLTHPPTVLSHQLLKEGRMHAYPQGQYKSEDLYAPINTCSYTFFWISICPHKKSGHNKHTSQLNLHMYLWGLSWDGTAHW